MCEILSTIASMQARHTILNLQKRLLSKGIEKAEIDKALIIKAYYFGQSMEVDSNPFATIDHPLRDDLMNSFDLAKGDGGVGTDVDIHKSSTFVLSNSTETIFQHMAATNRHV